MTDEDCRNICDAYAMAATAHCGLVDKVGQPYFYHLLRVAEAVRAYGPKFEIVGVLHDAVEDTDVTVAQIEARFGKEIADAVDAMTHREGEDYFEGYLPRVLGNPIARRVKFADSSDNLARVQAEGSPAEWRTKLRQRYERVLATIREAEEKV